MTKQCPIGYHLVITRYVKRNGKIIYPKKAKFFAFCIKDKAKTTA